MISIFGTKNLIKGGHIDMVTFFIWIFHFE